MVACLRKWEPPIGEPRSACQSLRSESVVSRRRCRARGTRRSSFADERINVLPRPPPPTPPHKGEGSERLCSPYAEGAAGAGGASVLWVPSQVGFLPERLQAQNGTSPAA